MGYLLQQLLEDGGSRFPEKTAVWARGESVTYGELVRRSNQLAHLLQDRGVKRGDRVGLCFPKSVESVISMFGTLKAGAAYVPLDPYAPPKWIAQIIKNCGIKVLLGTSLKLEDLDTAILPPDGFRILVDQPDTADTADQVSWGALRAFPDCQPPQCESIETDLAYILYTSGSSGEPKGVMLSHRNALTFVDWCADTFQIRPDDRLANHAPLHFDLSVFDIYNAVRAGATVCMIPDDVSVFPTSLAAFVETQVITVWYSVPSALTYLLLRGNLKSRNLERLRLVLFAGEPFPMKYLRQLAEILPHVELYNLYGPTETNVCTYYRVERSSLSSMHRLPIGKACANAEVFAVDENNRIIEPGQVGELYVRGASVMSGYWNDPEKTRRMVLPDRFRPDSVGKIYRTGDIVMLEPDGNYTFLGRNDSMIKSRGYRIELGEIETALYSHAAIRETAVVAIPDHDVGNRIKAFVVPSQPGALTKAKIQHHCAQRIPRYMIPELVEFCEVLPKTSTGKVDRKRLAGVEISCAMSV